MVRALFWKEWREHRWKLAGILTVHLARRWPWRYGAPDIFSLHYGKRCRMCSRR